MSVLRIISPFRPVYVRNIFRHKFVSLTTAHSHKDLEYSKPFTTTSVLCSRNVSTEVSPGIFRKFRNMLFDPPLLLPKSTLLMSGHLMYFCITEQLDFQYYIKEFDLPDTLNSYFILVMLHIWLCSVRLSTLGSEGEIVRNSMVEMMWIDIEAKGKEIIPSKSNMPVKKALGEYNDRLLYIFFSLDEGFLSDDKTLAGAIWRTIYEKRDIDPEKLELLVYYIRKQVHHIEKIESFKLLSKGVIQLLNIHGDKVNDKFLRMARKQLKLK